MSWWFSWKESLASQWWWNLSTTKIVFQIITARTLLLQWLHWGIVSSKPFISVIKVLPVKSRCYWTNTLHHFPVSRQSHSSRVSGFPSPCLKLALFVFLLSAQPRASTLFSCFETTLLLAFLTIPTWRRSVSAPVWWHIWWPGNAFPVLVAGAAWRLDDTKGGWRCAWAEWRADGGYSWVLDCVKIDCVFHDDLKTHKIVAN